MSDIEKTCDHCGKEITDQSGICPHCGEEQPVRWLVYLAYFLLGLFILGAVYRLVFP